MKFSKSQIRCKTHKIPLLRFEDQQLTSYSGLVVFQKLFERLSLKSQLRQCFQHLKVSPIFGHASIVLLLIVHMLLGYRDLRHVRYYNNDPLVCRLLGLKQLPDVSTISRTLTNIDHEGVTALQHLMTELVVQRLSSLNLARVTLDFDGSVIGTGRFAEGSAIGFNKKKKGQRSYYPLFCTIAQTGQVFDVLHRSGNVHDSNGAQTFILACIARIRAAFPSVVVEVRMDGAFFSDAIVKALDEAQVEYTISVPFERFSELKTQIEARCHWYPINEQCDYFEANWKPQSWQYRHRFVFVRQLSKQQHKQPLQLDLFIPYDYDFDFKVIVTNKTLTAGRVMAFHNGRGSQENIFSELKSDNQLAYVPTRTWNANKVYLLSVIIAHNLNRELQMTAYPAARTTQEKRPALWRFEKLDTLRKRLIQRAGRLIRPQGKLTLSMSANEVIEKELLHLLDAIEKVA